MDIPFNIFPVKPDKTPGINGWQEHATRCPDQIAAWEAQGAQAWGIPTGARNNLFVIDLDVNKDTGERTGELHLRESHYAHLLKQIAVRTPSGGAHLSFQHFAGARNTTSRIAPKIDTRGEGGYVVATGSITQSGTYKGTIPPLEPVPFGLRAMLLRKPPPPRPRGFDREAPTGEVEELLGHIPADLPYKQWCDVLMALHDRYGGSVEGVEIADRWSASGQTYKPGEVRKKWGSFTGSGITWATIPAMARQHGADMSAISKRWRDGR